MKKSRTSFFLSLFLLLFSVDSIAKFSATVGRTVMFEGDVVRLILETDFNPQSEPDFSVLEKDFTITLTLKSKRYEMINGNSSSYNTWTLSLLPKRKGEFIIPVMTVDNQSTQAIKLVVKAVSKEQLQKTADAVFIETEIGLSASNKKVYVQQQVPFIVRLYTDNTIHEGGIFIDELENGTIEKLGNDKQYTVTRNDKSFSVLERHYIVSADKSGQLVIPAPLFKGRQLESNKKSRAQSQYNNNIFNDPFFSDSIFGRRFAGITKPISVRGKPIELDILPVPSEFKDKEWLPAEDLVIIDSWTNKKPNFEAGEPTTRTLTIQVVGLLGTQTPSLNLDEIPKVRMYKEKDHTSTKTDGSRVFGIREQDITYIPSASGKAILPGFTLNWWNTKTGKIETFSLPEREVMIAKGTLPETVEPDNLAKLQTLIKASEIPRSEVIDNSPWLTYLLWLLGFAALIGSLIQMTLMFRHKKSTTAINNKREKIQPKSQSVVLKNLQMACENNNNKQAAQYLIQLAALEWREDKLTSVGVIATKINDAQSLFNLDKSLYAGGQTKWQGKALWQRIKKGLRDEWKVKIRGVA